MEIQPIPNPILEETITEIHKGYCPRCPSNKEVFPESDPEAEEIASYPDGIKQLYVFPCAWRSNKLCKGVCEELCYTEKEHADLLIKRDSHG
ncbi:receptor activity-modifying protein [bacterium]|nr:receptor activity-modifying protein [bacterium]